MESRQLTEALAQRGVLYVVSARLNWGLGFPPKVTQYSTVYNSGTVGWGGVGGGRSGERVREEDRERDGWRGGGGRGVGAGAMHCLISRPFPKSPAVWVRGEVGPRRVYKFRKPAPGFS